VLFEPKYFIDVMGNNFKMDGIRILGEWAYQYNLMTEGIVGENCGHWNIDQAIEDFKGVILECCDTCRDEYGILIPKFRLLAGQKKYEDAGHVGMEIQSLLVRAVQHKYPHI
jgi:hypothetical protein